MKAETPLKLAASSEFSEIIIKYFNSEMFFVRMLVV